VTGAHAAHVFFYIFESSKRYYHPSFEVGFFFCPGCTQSGTPAGRPQPSRLETRTKESNMCASDRVANPWRGAKANDTTLVCVLQARRSSFRYKEKIRTVGRSGSRWRTRAGAHLLGPERSRTMGGQGEARGNSGGGSQRYWRANRSSEPPIGAKDQSSDQVAGSLRSFPQDSWSRDDHSFIG